MKTEISRYVHKNLFLTLWSQFKRVAWTQMNVNNSEFSEILAWDRMNRKKFAYWGQYKSDRDRQRMSEKRNALKQR